jgi:hypothetical protein
MTDIQTEERSRTDQAKDAAADVASGAGDKASQVVDTTKDEAAQVADAAVQRVSDVVGSARDELRDRARNEAGNVGSSLSAVADELRAMGRASSENGGVTSGLVNNLAEQVDKGAQRLSDGDLEQVVDDVKRFARNRPGTFLLGAAGAGFLVGRLLRAADLKEVGQAVKPSSGDQSSQLTNGNGSGQAAIPAATPPVSPASPPPTAMGSATPAPPPPAPNPGSTPTPGAPS